MKVIQFIRFNKYVRSAGFLSAVLLFILSSLTIIPLVHHTEHTEAATGTATPSTLSLDITNSTASVDLTVASSNGTFASSASGDEASFSVSTNNYTGYTLSISADDNTGELVNGANTLSTIDSSVSGTLTDSTFNTTTYNNKWAYKPSKYRSDNTTIDNTGSTAVYLTSPTTEATTLDITTTANNESNTYTIGLGARADYTSPAGTYAKTFTLTAVGNPINYSVTYNKNTEDTVTNMPYSSNSNTQSGDTSSTSISLSNLIPVREHYSFLGWCNITPTTTNNVDSCTGTGAVIYNPNGDGTNLAFGIDQTTANSTSLYAMWSIDTYTCTKQYRLQNADGTYPSTYTLDGSETINYGDTCTYSKTITDYQGNTGNNTARSTSQTVTAATTLSLDFPRNTYTLTVDKNTAYISTAEATTTPAYSTNQYRWGQTVAISATASSGNEFTSWSQTSGTAGTFGSTTSASTTFTMGKGVATIYANGKSSEVLCDGTKLCVQYNGNGLTYDGKSVNRVNYNSTATQGTVTKYSHTPNISDDGTYSGSTYSSNMDTTDTVTINGAASLNATIYYDTESTSYDWVSVYQSPFDISDTNDATVSTTTGNLSGKLAGRKTSRTTSYATWYTKTYAVTGDTVKFHFKTDSSSNYYGYYAVITGTSTILSRTVSSGEYATPTGTNAIFHGWSSTQATAGGGLPSQVEYTDESEVKTKMSGDEGESKTLYAVWQQGQEITFIKDGNVSSIVVLNSDGTTAGTITTSGQSLVLNQGNIYTLKPTHNTGYGTNAITITSGVGTLSGKDFTVDSGSATISITSKVMSPMQSFDCSSLANIGDTEEVYDTRDNEVYLIGKLADGKCWMLDNLRLDLTNSTVLASLTTSNTNADANSLTSLRSGNRSAGAQYASSGFATWNSDNPNNTYNQAKANADYKDIVAPVTYGNGSGKIGVYYNFCATTAGSFCYDSGAGANTGISSQDICPAGWRIPIGYATGTGTIEYRVLYEAYNSNDTDFRNALSTPLSGSYIGSQASYQGKTGYFWSSTDSEIGGYGSNPVFYSTIVESDTVYASYGYIPYIGYSVRCILQ